MLPLNLAEVIDFIQNTIEPEFHDKKLSKLKKITLDDIIKRKNPYLFRAKRINSAADYITAVLDAAVSSGEETIFGSYLEKLAIFVCGQVYGGRKSGIKGMDLEFEEGNTKYLISIKSGPNWANARQIAGLLTNFRDARKTLSTSGGAEHMNIICIEACCYGIDNNPEKGTHLKLCGQRFWELISNGNETLYCDIIEPLAYKSKERSDELEQLYTIKLNLLTQDFITRFCIDGIIDWKKLVSLNSGKDRSIEAAIHAISLDAISVNESGVILKKKK